MKKIVAFIFLINFTYAQSQNVLVPDPSFKSYLLSRTDINTNGDSEIQLSEASLFADSIICLGLGINSIDGIEAFTNLSFLNIANNNVSNVDLSQNTQLKTFIGPMNNLTSLDVGNNTLLEELVFTDNNISAIDLTGLPQLRRIEFNGNGISSLDISQNPLLERLFASGNMIGNLDFSIFPNLKELELNGCGMTSLDITNNPLLTNLEIMMNDVSSLDFSQNTLLERVRVDFNEMPTLDLSMCPNLVLFGSFSCLNLEVINVQNGNNTNMLSFQANSSPNLMCIRVDDVAYSTANWTSVDNSNHFSLACELTIDEQTLNSIDCYPNPFTDQLTINATEEIERVDLFSEIGTLVLSVQPNKSNITLDVEGLSNGVYITNVYLGRDEKIVQRIVK